MRGRCGKTRCDSLFVYFVQRRGPGSTHTLRRDVGVEGGGVGGKGEREHSRINFASGSKTIRPPKIGKDLDFDLQRFFLGRQPNPAQLVLYR